MSLFFEPGNESAVAVEIVVRGRIGGGKSQAVALIYDALRSKGIAVECYHSFHRGKVRGIVPRPVTGTERYDNRRVVIRDLDAGHEPEGYPKRRPKGGLR